MLIFIKTESYELWNIVTNGPYVSMTAVDEKSQSKTEEQYTQEDFAQLSKNFIAMNSLFCGLKPMNVTVFALVKQLNKIGTN